MTGATKYRQDIQVLRGLAVLAVVVFHANETLFPLGYLGVDVFFVISGFVLHQVSSKNRAINLLPSCGM